MNEQNLKPFKKGVKHNVDPEKKKAKKALKDLLSEFSEDKYDDFVSEYDKLRGKAKCDVYLSVLAYVRPKYASIEFEDFREARDAISLLRGLSGYKND